MAPTPASKTAHFARADSPDAREEDEHLSKSERRLMHTLLDIEENERLDYAPKHTELIVERLIKLGFIEVRVTDKGRKYMRDR
jgi:hypothetical protein